MLLDRKAAHDKEGRREGGREGGKEGLPVNTLLAGGETNLGKVRSALRIFSNSFSRSRQ